MWKTIVHGIFVLLIATMFASGIAVSIEAHATDNMVIGEETEQVNESTSNVIYYNHSKMVDVMVQNSYEQETDVYQPTSAFSNEYWNTKYNPDKNIHLHNSSGCKIATLEEVVRFLANDDTETNLYIKGEYDCTQFAEDVVNNAIDNGILAGTVHLMYTTQTISHAIVVFPTSDKGYVYFDCVGSTRSDRFTQYSDRMVINLIPGENVVNMYLDTGKTKTYDKIAREVIVIKPEGMEFPRGFNEKSQTYT